MHLYASKITLMYFTLKIHYFLHICVYLVYSTGVWWMSNKCYFDHVQLVSNTSITLTSVWDVSNKCLSSQYMLEMGNQTKMSVLLKDMYLANFSSHG